MRLFRDHHDFTHDGDRKLTQAERIERAQEKWREANPPLQSDPTIHAKYWREDGTLRSRAEREAQERAQERADSIVASEAERRIGEQKPRPLNWAQHLLDAYKDRSGLSPQRRRDLEAKAKAIEKQIDQALATERRQAEREADPSFQTVAEHAAALLDGMRPEAEQDARIAVGIFERLRDQDSPDWSIYWAQVQVARNKSLAATRAERESLAASRYAAAAKHEAAEQAEAQQRAALEAERNAQ